MDMGEAKRLSYYDIPPSNAQSVKTFDGKTYKLRGAVAIENKTGNIERIAEIYYRIRSVVDESQKIIAKRKTQEDELTVVYRKRKTMN
jgi:hypothetical protein